MFVLRGLALWLGNRKPRPLQVFKVMEPKAAVALLALGGGSWLVTLPLEAVGALILHRCLQRWQKGCWVHLETS